MWGLHGIKDINNFAYANLAISYYSINVNNKLFYLFNKCLSVIYYVSLTLHMTQGIKGAQDKPCYTDKQVGKQARSIKCHLLEWEVKR